MQKIVQSIPNARAFHIFLFVAIFTIGSLVRIMRYPNLPPGINQDEASSAYEAYALLKTGKDRWGNKFPAYFPSWGSGQNVLQAYLSVPVIKLIGLNIFSARFVQLILGILILPLLFYGLQPLGLFTAFTAMFIVAISPWHFMLSRWALESNIVPFFMLLGCTTLSRAIISSNKKWIILSLIPFAVAVYAYGTTIVILPIFFIILVVLFYKTIFLNPLQWLFAGVLFLVVAFPFIVFFLENYLLHKNLALAEHFFFSSPLFPSNRLEQDNMPWSEMISRNLDFVFSDFDDHKCYNHMQGVRWIKPLLFFTMPFAYIGFFTAIYTFANKKRKTIADAKDVTIAIFFAWFTASIVLFFFLYLNINRFNHFFIPAIVMAVWFADVVIKNLNNNAPKIAIRTLIAIYLLVDATIAIRYYFVEYPKGCIAGEFNPGLKEAFDELDKLPVDQIRVTEQMPLPYMYTLFFTKYSPDKFQKEAQFEIDGGGTYKVNKFGKYVFYDSFLNHDKEYGYLSRKDEFHVEPKQKLIIYTDDTWEVGVVR